MAVEIRGAAKIGAPQSLLDKNIPPGVRFDESKDGRFLILVPVGQNAAASINALVNWQARLKK
jgi:hypothetical protein